MSIQKPPGLRRWDQVLIEGHDAVSLSVIRVCTASRA